MDQKTSSSSSCNDEVMRTRDERVNMYVKSLSKMARSLLGTPQDVENDDGPFSKRLLEIGSYNLDIIESLGFDIVDSPEDDDDEGMIVPFHNPPKKIVSPKYIAELTDCSCRSIEVYNKIYGTQFGNVELVKANVEPRFPFAFYVTFNATNQSGKTETFQAVVDIPFPKSGKEKEVEFVRVRPTNKAYYPYTTTTIGQEIKAFKSLMNERLRN